MRWLLLFVAAGLVGCGQSEPDVWSEYATALSVWESERRFQDEVDELLESSPDDQELKALKKKADSRVEASANHLKEVRKRVPGMP